MLALVLMGRGGSLAIVNAFLRLLLLTFWANSKEEWNGGACQLGDTAFILICAALVALMTPGLAFFYGGLVRRKNFLAIMMQSFISMGVVTTIWVFFGYSLAFSGDVGGVIGNFHWALLNHVGQLPGPWAPTIPALAHFVYQEMFAIITPALITGAFADRVKFTAYISSSCCGALVYFPFVHWSGAAGCSPSTAC